MSKTSALPSVSFANTSATPLFVQDVDNAGRHPFTMSCQSSGASVTFFAGCSISMPAGKEAVIETVSFNANADSANTQLVTSIQVTTNSGFLTVYDTLQDNGLSHSESTFQSSSALKLYADPSSTIQCGAVTKSTNPSGDLSLSACSVSGYFVTLP